MRCLIPCKSCAHIGACAGVPSDALKVAEYREVLRMRRNMLARGDGAFGGGEDAAYKNFSRVLSKVSAAARPQRGAAERRLHVCCWLRLSQRIPR